MSTSTRYYLVSLPVSDSVGATWSALQQSLSKSAFDTPAYKLHIPELRVGTLDSLLALSDDLVKANSIVEGVTHKIRRQVEDLERVSGSEAGSLSVQGVPVDSYITRFVWDEAKYPLVNPLRETVDIILGNVTKLEDDLKVRVAEYNNVKGQLSAINRKQSGSMAVRDLSSLVKTEDIVSSEHLTTIFVIVSKYSQKEWLSSYETLSTFVVPRSSKRLHEDNDYALFTVILFRKVSDTFKTAARERGFQVREFEYDPEAQQNRDEEISRLTADQENMRTALQQWCYASYGEVFSSWMHLCAIRLFVESILRYGLPPCFLAVVLAPPLKSEKKVRLILERLAAGKNSSFWKADEDLAMVGLTGGDAEIHPYVSITVNLAG
ncbi:hypothetical protein GOP47_0016957 [Adiantum capillus-veneris]|uniref:V-type proton ATPase subunit C n=1 Tax=Adiantum capillus-veneris TaxID=13818 RepID=A0A9D4UJ14_ADICA|nr:hypothetical protein GOP47_0016957 [Adiantum capillus-veneris]